MKYTVLATEDDRAVAKGLVFGLTEEGFEVHHAATGTAAIDMVESLHPHILLLDLRLPDISGFDVCRKIRCPLSWLRRRTGRLTGSSVWR